MTEYETAPGLLHYKGKLFSCPCGNAEMRVEIGPDPTRFWCTCGQMYTEARVVELKEGVESGQ